MPIIGESRLFDVLAAVGAGGGGGGGAVGATTIVVGGGGLPSTASHVITINRYGMAQPIIIDLGTDPAKSALINIPIFPRDTIVVPASWRCVSAGRLQDTGSHSAAAELARSL